MRRRARSLSHPGDILVCLVLHARAYNTRLKHKHTTGPETFITLAFECVWHICSLTSLYTHCIEQSLQSAASCHPERNHTKNVRTLGLFGMTDIIFCGRVRTCACLRSQKPNRNTATELNCLRIILIYNVICGAARGGVSMKRAWTAAGARARLATPPVLVFWLNYNHYTFRM